MRIGVDVGGTFTDLVLLEDGRLSIHKVLSTPADLSMAVLAATAETGRSLAEVNQFSHGTTVTTNAVIMRTGAPTGLLTTRGFRDVLQIRRTTRGSLYDFQWDPPAELVERRWRREVAERTDAFGTVLRTPDVDGAVAEARRLVEEGVDSLAVCFINAYLNGANERAVRSAIEGALPGLPVYLSSAILPEWREFERTSTTVVSAYIGPVLSTYLERLESALRQRGYGYDLLLMLSNGGLATATAATERPAYTIGSGPAAGVLAQLALGQASDAAPAPVTGGVEASMTNIIGMDIGGTSTDISLVYDGKPFLRSDFELEFGTPVSYPVIEIDSIGAGGGTIAWLDSGGMLHMGPQSAGADPGPACMELGGTEPTLTDANVLLSRLNPGHLLRGAISLSADAARTAIASVADALGLDVVATADGIRRLAVSNIVFAIRQRTVERGLDPREFVIVAYGGAGPLHATEVADEVGINTVLIPPHPGVTSALGLLLTDIRHDFVSTFLRLRNEVTPSEVAGAYELLAARARELLATEGVEAGRVEMVYAMDLRYVGQTHELTVNLPGPYLQEVHDQVPRLFQTLHQAEYGHSPNIDEPIEIVNLRLAGVGRMDRPELPELPVGESALPQSHREVFFGEAGGWIPTPVYDRDDLLRGSRIDGPAVVEQLDSTTVIPPGWTGEPDRVGSLILRRH
ncbi:MAG: hydantoinase/oxoprolinase family protein [bacterium]|nr:hydantoinase/oxoprolinase family protein [bacterium]MDE0602729.1 hydantoinase/oxoprolinase family protein [bacterium]